jgi:peptide deformylase
VGLAAPQVGRGIQLAVLADGPERWGQLTEEERAARERSALAFTVLVNPVAHPIDPGADRVSFFEGCLSVPGLMGVVARHRAVRVEALDADGQPLYLDQVETRSLSSSVNYARYWAGRPPSEAAVALGFSLD